MYAEAGLQCSGSVPAAQAGVRVVHQHDGDPEAALQVLPRQLRKGRPGKLYCTLR